MNANLYTLLATVLPIYWIKEWTARLVWAFDTLGCLGYLHGRHGSEASAPPAWVRRVWARFAGRKGLNVLYSQVRVEWATGTISWPEGDKERSSKLGKWLRKAGASATQMHEFETRVSGEWEWKISCSPIDILTMSFNRSWSSCMRPGARFETGLFSDVRAGAAVLFWYRPGADQPCGREVLRPAFDGSKPIIIRGGTTYGVGGVLTGTDLTTICGVEVVERPLQDVESSCALCDGVYDDLVREGCVMESEEIEVVEERLLFAWREFLSQGGGLYVDYPPQAEERETYVSQPSERERRRLEGRISVLRNSLSFSGPRQTWWGEPVTYTRPDGWYRTTIESQIAVYERQLSSL